MDLRQVVGRNVRQLRLAHGLTLRELARAITPTAKAGSNIVPIEKGEQNLTLDVIEKLGEALDVPPKCLLDPDLEVKVEITVAYHQGES